MFWIYHIISILVYKVTLIVHSYFLFFLFFDIDIDNVVAVTDTHFLLDYDTPSFILMRFVFLISK